MPNTGRPVKPGTTVEIAGPGKAVLDKNGNITVMLGKDAKPGSKIAVVVKDSNGKEIGKFTVNVGKKSPSRSLQ
ncbi:MAG: hypothetical protein Q4A71_07820 [Actinomycetaceae bacterium]|nr:hypothetical protein [Actinomycetaceae bacterium]